MRNIVEYKKTLNRSVYNRARKRYLDEYGYIHCSRCQYHFSDNLTTKWYGISSYGAKNRYPNWKLVSKNKKQWMQKTSAMRFFGFDNID